MSIYAEKSKPTELGMALRIWVYPGIGVSLSAKVFMAFLSPLASSTMPLRLSSM